MQSKEIVPSGFCCYRICAWQIKSIFEITINLFDFTKTLFNNETTYSFNVQKQDKYQSYQITKNEKTIVLSQT